MEKRVYILIGVIVAASAALVFTAAQILTSISFRQQ